MSIFIFSTQVARRLMGVISPATRIAVVLNMPRTTARSSQCHQLSAPLSIVLCTLLTVSVAFAQPGEDYSHFEVASIKRADRSVRFSYAGPDTGDPGRIILSGISLKELIERAYSEYGERISGPPWINDKYSVAATIPPGSASRDISQMLRNLIAERFGLKFHGENKDVQGFELSIGGSGFKLTPSTTDVDSVDSEPPSNAGTPDMPYRPKLDQQGAPILTQQGTFGSSYDYQSEVVRTSFHRCSMKQLAGMLSMTYGERSVPVIDKTEIKGLFDFHLVLPLPSITRLPAGFAAQTSPSSSPDAWVADLRGLSGSLEKQTGLRLKAVKLTLPMMIIEHVSRTPTEN